jgi:hypothetical protein
MAGTGHLLPNSSPRGPLKPNGYSDRPQPEPLPCRSPGNGRLAVLEGRRRHRAQAARCNELLGECCRNGVTAS